MAKARVLWLRSIQITPRFRAEVRVYEVQPSVKYPEGIKARFALIDGDRNVPRLVVDNHAPYGFHAHTNLPEDETTRVQLNVSNYLEAYDEFLSETERIIRDEE